MQTNKMVPADAFIRSRSGRPQALLTENHSPEVYTVRGYGMVGTGRTPEKAREDLFEKIKLAGQA